MAFRRLRFLGILATASAMAFGLFLRPASAQHRPAWAGTPSTRAATDVPQLPLNTGCFGPNSGLLRTLAADADLPPASGPDCYATAEKWVESERVSRPRTCSDSVPGPGCPLQPIAPASKLSAGDKRQAAILGIRERALRILSGENACSAWFREKEPDALETFRTLSFALDPKAQDFITETRTSMHRTFYPWVAKVMQGGGPYQVVTLNVSGAFFRPSAYVHVVPPEGGPAIGGGARSLRVGPYLGGTVEAQLTTVLHELGHTIGLLEFDEGDVAGKSAHNTELVLEHCQSQILEGARSLLAGIR
jgi:hypothetical protein